MGEAVEIPKGMVDGGVYKRQMTLGVATSRYRLTIRGTSTPRYKQQHKIKSSNWKSDSANIQIIRRLLERIAFMKNSELNIVFAIFLL